MIRHCFHLILGGGGDLTKQKWESDTFSFVLLQHDDAKRDETRSSDVNSSKFAQWFLEDGMHALIYLFLHFLMLFSIKFLGLVVRFHP